MPVVQIDDVDFVFGVRADMEDEPAGLRVVAQNPETWGQRHGQRLRRQGRRSGLMPPAHDETDDHDTQYDDNQGAEAYDGA